MELGIPVRLIAPDGGDNYRWLKDGMYLDTSDKMNGIDSQELLIDRLSMDDFGMYTCQFDFNGIQYETYEFHLSIDVKTVPMTGVFGLAILMAVIAGCGVYIRIRS